MAIAMTAPTRHCEERSDAAIHKSWIATLLSLRGAKRRGNRNDGPTGHCEERNDSPTRHFQAALRRIWAGL